MTARAFSPLAHHHDAADHVAFAVVVGDAAAHLRPERHGGDVLHHHRRAAFGLKHQVLDVVNALHVSAAAHHVLAAGKLDQAAAHVVVARCAPH